MTLRLCANSSKPVGKVERVGAPSRATVPGLRGPRVVRNLGDAARLACGIEAGVTSYSTDEIFKQGFPSSGAPR